MTLTGRITARSESPEHPVNGVETGFSESQGVVKAAIVLERCAASWRECRRLDVALLRALAALMSRSPTQGLVGFDSREIAEEIGRVLGRKWGAGDSNEAISDKVRINWNRLSGETWGKKIEGVLQEFEQWGLPFEPVLDRVEGGGTGNPTRYRLTMRPLQAEGAARAESSHRAPREELAAAPPASTGRPLDARISYICEDVEDASWLARSFAKGFQLEGWRRQVLRAVVVFGLLVVAAAWILVAVALVGTSSLSDLAYAALAAVIYAYAFWSMLGHLLMLHSWRIALAPWWMQSADDDRLIEWRCPPRYEAKSIKAVRYTAKCPLCGGKVVARSGGVRRAWALVGRCEEAPDAHVFSFDHVLREGRLRP